MSACLRRPPVFSSPRPSIRNSPRPIFSPRRASDAAETIDAFSLDFCPSLCCGNWRNNMSAMANPRTESPRNSIDSLSKTPPLASSWTRDRCVSACSRMPRSLKRYPIRRSSGSSSDPNGTTRPGPLSSRWLSMICLACAALSACTAIRSSLTVRGNGVRDRSEDTMVAMPCVSSRPRTTSASICAGVLKMTTSSVMGRAAASYRYPAGRRERMIQLQENHRHVVMLVGNADKGLDLAHDPLAKLAGVEVPVFVLAAAETAIPEVIALGFHGLGDAVRVQHDHVTRRQIHSLFLEQRREHVGRPVDAEPHHHPVRNQHPHRRERGRRTGEKDQRRMSGAAEGHHPGLEIDDGVGHGDEAAAVEMLRDDAIDLDEQVARRP